MCKLHKKFYKISSYCTRGSGILCILHIERIFDFHIWAGLEMSGKPAVAPKRGGAKCTQLNCTQFNLGRGNFYQTHFKKSICNPKNCTQFHLKKSFEILIQKFLFNFVKSFSALFNCLLLILSKLNGCLLYKTAIDFLK